MVIEGSISPSDDSSVVFGVAEPWLGVGKEGTSVPIGGLGMMIGTGVGSWCGSVGCVIAGAWAPSPVPESWA